MEPLQIVVRVVFGYAFALTLTRISGHRSIKHLDASSFVIAIVMGDMFDDLVWAEVPASQFVVALSSVFLIHLWVNSRRCSAGARDWARGGMK